MSIPRPISGEWLGASVLLLQNVHAGDRQELFPGTEYSHETHWPRLFALPRYVRTSNPMSVYTYTRLVGEWWLAAYVSWGPFAFASRL